MKVQRLLARQGLSALLLRVLARVPASELRFGTVELAGLISW